ESAGTRRSLPCRVASVGPPFDAVSLCKENSIAPSSPRLSDPAQNISAKTARPFDTAALAATSSQSKSPRADRCKSPAANKPAFSLSRSPLPQSRAGATETPRAPSPPFQAAPPGARTRPSCTAPASRLARILLACSAFGLFRPVFRNAAPARGLRTLSREKILLRAPRPHLQAAHTHVRPPPRQLSSLAPSYFSWFL